MAPLRLSDRYWGPFKSDCEEILGRFQQTESVRFEVFSTIWREMDFASVFFAIRYNNEKRSFAQLTFITAIRYLLPPYSFQIRVGALYVLYGLFNTQLGWPKEKIRIALKDWYDVQKFITDAITCQHLDVVYVFKRLLTANAFCFTAMPKKLTFEACERVQHNVNEEFREQRDAVAEVASVEMLEEIANVHGHYERLKKLSLPTSSGVTLLNLTDSVGKCIFDYRQWQDKITASKKDSKKNETTPQSEPSSRADLVSNIKSKSYSHLSKGTKSRRHRQIEMATTGSGNDQDLDKSKGKFLSLKTRTYKTFGKSGEPDMKQGWLLSVKEEDKTASKRKDIRRFKW